jgi:PmbA protein
MDIDKALDILMKEVDEAEIYFSKSTSNEIEIKKGSVDLFKESYSIGYGIRVINKGKLGFAFSNSLDEKVIRNALATAKISEQDKFHSLPEKQRYSDVKDVYDPKLMNIQPEEMSEFAAPLMEACESHGVQATTGGIAWSSYEVKIMNSLGLRCKDKGTACSCYLSTVAKDDKTATGFYSDASRKLDLDFYEIGATAAKLAKDSLNAERIDTLTSNIILKPHAVAGLFEHALIPSFNADNVQRNRSLLAGKLNQRVFSERLNIIDDGRLKKGLLSAKFDGEGVKTQRTVLVNNGVLKNYLYDIYTANKGNAKSTGNSERDSYYALPQVDASNFIISGEGNITGRGLVVYGLIGAHTANPVTGDFSVETKNAFLNDKPVKKAIISGNIFELLNKVEGTGKDYKQVSSVFAPTVEFSEVRVIG